MRKFVFIAISLYMGCLSAATFLPIDSTVLHKVTLSNRYQNRIAVSGGRIQRVIHPEGELNVTLEEHSGQVFVYSLSEYIEPITLSIVTEEGIVQDLQLNFASVPTEIIILEQAEEKYEIDEIIDEPCKQPCSDQRVQTVESIIRRETPAGFYSCEINEECRKIKLGVRAVLISKLVSLHETLYVWRVENMMRRIQTLNEREINFQKGSWVYLDKCHLGPKDHTLSIVAVRNNESKF